MNYVKNIFNVLSIFIINILLGGAFLERFFILFQLYLTKLLKLREKRIALLNKAKCNVYLGNLSLFSNKMNIFFRVQDLGIIRDIFLYKIYPVNLINLKKDNDLIIDIGAHIGCFSLLANKLTNKEVIAIEPEEENFKLLTKNILLNKAKIMPVKCAISNYNKTKKFYKSFSTLSHSLRKISETFEYVKVMKLKTLLKKMKITLNDIKLIKLDAEGEELRIIRDSKNILSKKPILFIDVIEISRKERESMYKLLKKMNFSVLFFKKAGIYLAL